MAKVMVITGGGRGIGAATACLAAQKGYAVCVNYRQNEAAARAVVTQIEQQGGRAIALPADISSEADVMHLFNTVDTQLGPLTALVNNAGIIDQQSRVEDFTVERLNKIFATNVVDLFCVPEKPSKECLPKTGAQGVRL